MIAYVRSGWYGKSDPSGWDGRLSGVRLRHAFLQLAGDRGAQVPMPLVGVGVLVGEALLVRVAGDGGVAVAHRFPGVAGVDVGGQVVVGVAEDLVVDPPEARVEPVARGEHRLADQAHGGPEPRP